MKLEITIPDNTFATYATYTSASRPTPVDAIEHQLERFSALNPKDRWLLISPEHRQAIESALGGLSVSNTAKLVSRIQAHASVHLGKQQIMLSTGQLREIEDRAKRNGKDPKVELERILGEIMRDYTRAI